MSEAAAGGEGRDGAVVVLLALGLALAALRVLAFVDAHAVNLMMLDQWDFYAPLFDGEPGALGKFRYQFWGSPHRMGIGYGLIEPVARASDWDGRADAFAVAAVMIAAAAFSLWLKRRLLGRSEAWDLLLVLLVLSLKPYTSYLETPDVSLAALPLLLVFGLAFALTLRGAGARLAALAFLNLLCVYTGFALFAGLLTPLLVLRERWAGSTSWGATGLTLAIVLASGASFWVGYESWPMREPLSGERGVLAHATYANNLFSSFFEARGPLAYGLLVAAWPVAFALAAFDAGRRLRSDPRAARPAAELLLIAFTLLFVVANALGRVGMSVGYAYEPRYLVLLVPGFAGVLLVVYGLPKARLRSVLLSAIAALLLLSEAVAGEVNQRGVAELTASKQAWRRCYLASRDFDACNARVGPIVYPWKQEYPRIRARLAQLERQQLNLFKAEPAP